MNLSLLVAAGFFLVFLVVVLPVMRERYEEEYSDDRDFFKQRRPRMWGLIEGVAGGDGAAGGDGEHSAGWCPACGVENDPAYTYCRNCDSRLPT